MTFIRSPRGICNRGRPSSVRSITSYPLCTCIRDSQQFILLHFPSPRLCPGWLEWYQVSSKSYVHSEVQGYSRGTISTVCIRICENCVPSTLYVYSSSYSYMRCGSKRVLFLAWRTVCGHSTLAAQTRIRKGGGGGVGLLPATQSGKRGAHAVARQTTSVVIGLPTSLQ